MDKLQELLSQFLPSDKLVEAMGLVQSEVDAARTNGFDDGYDSGREDAYSAGYDEGYVAGAEEACLS